VDRSRNKTLFYVGVGLLLVNSPLGYVGLGVSGLIYVKTGNAFWLKLGGVFYAFTWVMLGLGAFLAGPEGLVLAKVWWKRLVHRKDRAEGGPRKP
jgi:hypothetical protein